MNAQVTGTQAGTCHVCGKSAGEPHSAATRAAHTAHMYRTGHGLMCRAPERDMVTVTVVARRGGRAAVPPQAVPAADVARIRRVWEGPLGANRSKWRVLVSA